MIFKKFVVLLSFHGICHLLCSFSIVFIRINDNIMGEKAVGRQKKLNGWWSSIVRYRNEYEYINKRVLSSFIGAGSVVI